MATRTVRLDEQSEHALAEIRRATGASVSAALKRGLLTARDALRAHGAASPFEIYQSIDLGPGGYAQARARRAKAAVRSILRERDDSRRHRPTRRAL